MGVDLPQKFEEAEQSPARHRFIIIGFSLKQMFCATCGTVLFPLKTEYGKWLSCPRGHTQPQIRQEGEILISKSLDEGKRLDISDGINPLAVHHHPCKNCGHQSAELIEIAPFYSDEDSIIRMKCGKCGKVEQLEGKVK